jgi:hypothetical protein
MKSKTKLLQLGNYKINTDHLIYSILKEKDDEDDVSFNGVILSFVGGKESYMHIEFETFEEAQKAFALLN